MAYVVKYIMQVRSDRGNDIRIEILQRDYEGEVISKSLGGAPLLTIDQGDGAIKGSSLTFAIQADVEGELQELYTTDNKLFKVNLYKNDIVTWQGYVLPELYSENYVDPPYDVTVTATDGLATLKAVPYEGADVSVTIATIISDILRHTQMTMPIVYHMQMAHMFAKVSGDGLNTGMQPIPMLVNTYISQAAYNGYSCYDVLNQILQSCNCCIMQMGGEWLISSLTDSSDIYYSAGVSSARAHKILGQLGAAEVYPSGSLTMVNSPAYKGVNVEYSHMLKNSFLNNADCVNRKEWNYTPDSRNPIDIPGEREAFGKIFKAYCWELHPNNIQNDNSLQLWQDVVLAVDIDNIYNLSFKSLFATNAKLLLLSITHIGDDGINRQLTGEGWVTQWNKSDVNSYIQITGQNKGGGLQSISNIKEYEDTLVQFHLPEISGSLRIGFINSTKDYAEPLASAPIYVTQVYLTVGSVTGQQCTTLVEPNATQEQPGVLLVYGDTFASTNAVQLELNTLKNASGQNVSSWWLNGQQYASYYDMMLQEYSRYFGVKKMQLQGVLMGQEVLHNIYFDTHSEKTLRLLTASVDLLSEEASVTLEEIVDALVEFDAVVEAAFNNNQFGSTSGGGMSSSGGSGSGSSGGEGGGAAGEVTAQSIVDALGYIPYDSRNPNKYITSAALEPYVLSDSLAAIVARIDRDIANRALTEDLKKLEESVTDIAGYFINGSANNALKLGGQQPSYYATVNALGTTNTNVSNLATRVTNTEAAIKSNSTAISTNATNITTVANRVKTLEDLGFTLKDGYIYTEKTIVSKGEIISGRRASGASTDVGGGGISSITAQMIADALGYIPYSSANPAGYINSSALNGYAKLTDIPSLSGYATEQYVTSRGYITGISSKMVTDALGYTPYNSANFTKATIKNTLGIADWALAVTKPTYTASEVGALPLSGGTLSSNLTIQNKTVDVITLYRDDVNNSPSIKFTNKSDGTLGYIGVLGSGSGIGIQPFFMDSAGAINKVWHSGNFNPSNYLPLSGGTISGSSSTILTINRTGGIPYVCFNKDGSLLGFLGIRTEGYPVFVDSGGVSFQMLHSGNYSGYALPLSGGTLTGSLTVNGGVTCDLITRYDSNAGYLFGSRNTALGLTDGGALVYAYGGTPISMYTNGLERMRVAPNGNILIGTATDDGNKLQIGGSVSLTNELYCGGWLRTTADRGWYNETYGGGIYMTDTNFVRVYNGKGFQVDGNVLIGTTTDSGDKLRINGAVRAAGHIRLDRYHGASEYLQLEAEGVNINYRAYDTDGWCSHNFYSNDNLLVRIDGYAGKLDVNGNLVATGEVISSRRASSSDRRLKNNISYLDTADCLAMVRHIRPAEWDWKDNGKHSMGFIAQDVEHLMPYAVTSVRDNMLGYKMNLQYDQFIALAIGGVQAVDSEVQQLKKEVKELKEKLAKYEHNGNYRN